MDIAMADKMTNKIKQARHSGLVLTLSASEARLFASVCHTVSSLNAPRMDEDLAFLGALKGKAITARRQNASMSLEKGEVELIGFCLSRASVCSSNLAPYDALGT
jgi:hypothetical protein